MKSIPKAYGNPLAILVALFLVATTILSGGSALAGSVEAVAAPQISGSASFRYCIKTNLLGCQPAGKFSAGAASMICWKDGSTATGAYPSKRWFYVTQGSRKGWAHSSWVTRQTNVPSCSTHRGVSAATWAAETNGQTKAPRAVADWAWGPGVDPRWSGGCAGLVSAAYYFGAKVTPRYRGDAVVQYRAYRSAGLVRSMSTEPQIGSAVFWPTLSDWGHTAIYVGNGYVMTTQGYPGDTFPNKRVKMTSLGSPAGWVTAAEY